MDVREWSLIIFTILTQMAVGAFVVLGIVHFFAVRQAGEAEADRLSDRALLAIGPVLVLALIVSLFHLGNPLNAYRAVANVASSWLSREILASVLFTAVGAVFAVMQWRKLGSFTLRAVIAAGAAVIGLFQVYSMSMVYQLPTQPAWNTIATPIAFFATALLLGVLAVGAAFVANYAFFVKRETPGSASVQSDLLHGALRWIAVAAVVLLGVELVAAPLQVAYLAAGATQAARASAALMFGQYGLIFGLRLALAFIGAGVFTLYLYRSATTAGQERTMATLAYAAFALVLVAEVLGRYVFYAAHVKIGL
ncbi:MAG: dimethyl sulfoxide reductase anchor subunit [Anaerolineales bacterium]|nr:dimethyl sulfoxide reductase anchor subunit [Anaerolineales bacterium]